MDRGRDRTESEVVKELDNISAIDKNDHDSVRSSKFLWAQVFANRFSGNFRVSKDHPQRPTVPSASKPFFLSRLSVTSSQASGSTGGGTQPRSNMPSYRRPSVLSRLSFGSATSRGSTLMPMFPAKNSIAEYDTKEETQNKYFETETARAMHGTLDLPKPQIVYPKEKEEPKKKSNFTGLFCGLLVLLLIAGGASGAALFAVEEAKQKGDDFRTLAPTSTPTISPTVSPTRSPTQPTPFPNSVNDVSLSDADDLCAELNNGGGTNTVCLNTDEFFTCIGRSADRTGIFLTDLDISTCSGNTDCSCEPLTLVTGSNPCKAVRDPSICS